ncbi:LamG-like jellyroll fold domain-containing protein [Paenibacillus sp. PL91]|uniref:LamG-like jellyroll fold domain-containing protein n=1 Tax=Paenibacillus sp. PL91 TaxID=2729538 RepID=UPI00145E5B78|nr:LamG-like jellyroll fold domain-containing protein [Paenibacillus sp. PL91]MBC9204061.1 discoidin domain-containing protein [Paenibacillus sp. PL91]
MLKKVKTKSCFSLALLLVVNLVIGIATQVPAERVSAEGENAYQETEDVQPVLRATANTAEGAYTYQVTEAPEWDAVFNKTDHMGDGFLWLPFGIKNRQGLGTSLTKSAILFNDSFVGDRWNWVSGSTLGKYTGIDANTPSINYVWGTNGQKQNYNPLHEIDKAESGYSGTVAWNLVSGYGMSGIRSTSDTHDTNYRKMWLSDHKPSVANSYVIFDAYAVKELGKMYIWNFNEPTHTSKGLKNIKIFTSEDGVSYTEFTGDSYPFQIPQAGGTAPNGYAKEIDFGSISSRYVKITYNPVSNDGNWGDLDMFGLSAVRLYDSTGHKLVLSARAGSTADRTKYKSVDSWSKSGITLGNYLYFYLHNRDNNAFQLMRYTITNGEIDFNSLKAFDALPYMYYQSIPSGFSPQAGDARVGNTIRLKEFESLAFWEDDDGYVYGLGADEIYDGVDPKSKSKLLLSRVPKDSFEDFNAREYWNGTGWSRNYETASNLKDVSGNDIVPVGNIPGFFKAKGGQLDGKYVLVYMENVDGDSYFRVADHPSGPWSDKNLLYAREGNEYIYNTGAVPFISKEGEFYFYLIKNETSMKFFKYSEVINGDSPNLALNKTVTADSACSDTTAAADAVDGSVIQGEKWCSSSNDRWLHVDLGSEQKVNQFVIKHASEAAESASYNTKAYTIQVSNDDTNWTTVVNVDNNKFGVTVNSIAEASARYIKLNVTTPTQTTDQAARIYEFEVYGPNPTVKTLHNVITPKAITATIGVAKTAEALELPAKIMLATDAGALKADVTWEVAGTSYDPTVTTGHTFTVNGVATLPTGVINPNNAPLTTTISVTTKHAELVAHWKLNEGSGTTAGDSSGNNNTLSLVNNPTWTNSGKIGGAITFGGGSRAEINPTATLNKSGDETVSLWFKTSQPATKYLNLFQQDKRFTALQLTNEGTARAAYWPQAPSRLKLLTFPWTYSDNEWHHYVASYSHTMGMKIYVDGSLVASDETNIGKLLAVTNKIVIGANESGGEAYNGLLDDVRVFSGPLDQAQVTQLMNAAVDQVAPTTTDNAPSGWVNQDITVSLSASDNGSGVANTYYTVDDGAEQTGTSVVLLEEGVHKLVYWSVDKAGNVEVAQSLEVKIDLTSPVVKITGAPSYTIDQTVTMTCSATDVISSVYGTPCAKPLLQAKAYTLLSGQNTVSVTAEDMAGHKTTATHTFMVKATFDSLKTVTTAFLQATNVKGWESVATSLNSKLDQAKAAAASGKIDAAKSMMADYIGKVTGQSGKSFTKEQADILIRWAKTII